MSNKPDTNESRPTSGLACGVLFGEFVRAGTMNVSGEKTIGCAIAMTEDALRAAPRLPFYRRVAIVVAEDYERLDRYCAALEEQLDTIGLQKAQHIAGLSSPNAADEGRAKRVPSGRLLDSEPQTLE